MAWDNNICATNLLCHYMGVWQINGLLSLATTFRNSKSATAKMTVWSIHLFFFTALLASGLVQWRERPVVRDVERTLVDWPVAWSSGETSGP